MDECEVYGGMVGTDGADYANHCVFAELDKPRRIVMEHVSNPQFSIVATFEGEAGKTRYTFCMIFKTAAECLALRKLVVGANEQNIDRLEAVLIKMA